MVFTAKKRLSDENVPTLVTTRSLIKQKSSRLDAMEATILAKVGSVVEELLKDMVGDMLIDFKESVDRKLVTSFQYVYTRHAYTIALKGH